MSLQVCLPIFLGVFIYLAWRTPTILLFHWIDAACLTGPVHNLRAWMQPLRTAIPDIVVFSLPTALWTYAITVFNVELWRDQPASTGKLIWFVAGALLSVGGEIGQRTAQLPGTFDAVDLYASVFAALVAGFPLLVTSMRRNSLE